MRHRPCTRGGGGRRVAHQLPPGGDAAKGGRRLARQGVYVQGAGVERCAASARVGGVAADLTRAPRACRGGAPRPGRHNCQGHHGPESLLLGRSLWPEAGDGGAAVSTCCASCTDACSRCVPHVTLTPLWRAQASGHPARQHQHAVAAARAARRGLAHRHLVPVAGRFRHRQRGGQRAPLVGGAGR